MWKECLRILLLSVLGLNFKGLRDFTFFNDYIYNTDTLSCSIVLEWPCFHYLPTKHTPLLQPICDCQDVCAV
jgi:hypothetical protein